MTGIYKITCKSNNKVYIGQSMSIKRRWREHQTALKRNNHYNLKMTHKGFYWIYEKDYKLLKKNGYDFSKKRNKKSMTIQDLIDKGALDGDI